MLFLKKLAEANHILRINEKSHNILNYELGVEIKYEEMPLELRILKSNKSEVSSNKGKLEYSHNPYVSDTNYQLNSVLR